MCVHHMYFKRVPMLLALMHMKVTNRFAARFEMKSVDTSWELEAGATWWTTENW
jgi:hypothetical protein